MRKSSGDMILIPLINRFVSKTTFIYSAFPNRFFFSSLSISGMSANGLKVLCMKAKMLNMNTNYKKDNSP